MNAAVASVAPLELQGSAFGVFAAIQSFGNLAASDVARLLWTIFSPTVALGYLDAWMVIASVALVGVGPLTEIRAHLAHGGALRA